MNSFKILFFLPLFIPDALAAQTVSTDSTRYKTAQYITSDFPPTRTLDIQFEDRGATNYQFKQDGAMYEKGTLRENAVVKVTANIPTWYNKHFILLTNLKYQCYHRSFDHIKTSNSIYTESFHSNKTDYHHFETALSLVHNTHLFGKPLACMANVSFDGSHKGYERAQASLMATMVLTRNHRTLTTLGLIYLTNMGGLFPVLPIFSYAHKPTNSSWIIDIALPRHLYFRKNVLKNGRLSLGSLLDGERFYLYPNVASLPRKCYFVQNFIKTEAMYEHKLGKHIYLTGHGGCSFTFRSRLYNKKQINKDPVFTYTQHPSVYLNVGISYNLF
mgnify:FL=1